ncbi:MFS transporter [Sphingobium jiangsuense]|uniref:MFS family permease n=1 Tax=Sphingobium jiangsuense TaxID=870476 RepID=A0A7W6BV16_9SPHN|nr:MFS transporter [Sphingobium jiangsuense]MBB3928374.1 MFS family permease [Sphingobium jiangsuense]GLS99755.1 MFS transporter [Sphingobium jiangsuense]
MRSPVTVESIRQSLDDARMTRAQVVAIVVAVLIAGLDGYDLQAMAFVAPAVSEAWGVSKEILGLLLASSLIGMAAGSLGLSPLADVVGRRPMVLLALALLTLGSLASALSRTIWELGISRGVTGLGIGVMMSLTTAVAAEFSNGRSRAFAIAATTVGVSVGGMLGGLAAAALLETCGWEWVFGLAALLGAVLFFLALIALPESPAFLIARWPKSAFERLNGVLARLEQPAVTEAPLRPEAERSSYRALFARGMASTTIRFAVVYMLTVTAAFYIISWLPQMVADAGFPPSTASLISITTSLVGVPSALIAGTFATRFRPVGVASAAMVGFGLALVLLGIVPPTGPALIFAAGACGFFLSASTAVFYASIATAFTPLMRVSGIGFVSGFGLLLGGLGPYFAGLMFGYGMSRTGVSFTFAIVAAAAGVLLFTHRSSTGGAVGARAMPDR